jgi:hypothetical protein
MKPGKTGSGWKAGVAALLLGIALAAAMARDQAVEELKERVANVGISQRPSLCIEISERQLETATKLYESGDGGKALAALVDVVAFSGLARDYAIQSHRSQKQSEIAIRKMARRLGDLKHAALREDQEQIQDTIDRLQSIRDDLLSAMFPHGVKK